MEQVLVVPATNAGAGGAGRGDGGEREGDLHRHGGLHRVQAAVHQPVQHSGKPFRRDLLFCV